MTENYCCCNRPVHGPEDLLKFSVLKDVVVDYDTAVNYLKEKSDVPGEPCIVRYCIDGSLYRNDVPENIGVVLGIGNSYGSEPFIITSEIQKLVTNSYINLDGSLYNIPNAINYLQEKKITTEEAEEISQEVLDEYINDTSICISALKTSNKSIVGAINELYDLINGD